MDISSITLADHSTRLIGALAPRLLSYIDPGTGSLVLQVVVGAVIGALVAAKVYWQRVKSFFVRRHPGEDANRGPGR
jgi:hypothetical protein